MAQFLVLEADRRQFENIKQCLQTNGHKAWRVTTPDEASKFLKDYSVDVILSTVHLEGVDVYAFLRDMQQQAAASSKAIPFVFYCTQQEDCDRYATETITKAGLALGAAKYVMLPEFDANRFWEQLEECVPQNAIKNDSLGSEVKVYPLTDYFWTARKAQ